MRFKSFSFANFRGIKYARLNLAGKTDSHINVLVGLNESGKTTVLEAIHHFMSNPDLSKKMPSSRTRVPADYQAMLPISERYFFNGTIEICASVEIEGSDWDKIDAYLSEQFGFFKTRKIKEFRITHEITFEDSKFKSVKNIWSIYFMGTKKPRARKLARLEGEDWLKAANFVELLLPKVVYFPVSLFEFPDRIILEQGDLKEPRNDFYCGVFEDILAAINPKLKLKDHLIDRVKSKNSAQLENLEALLSKIGEHLKSTVLGEWNAISAGNTSGIDFRVTVKENSGQIALEIKIKTSEGIFSVNEKSAGFRWFFAYVLLTRYRLYRKDRVLFLFDEPAANLHPNAQSLLLKSFKLLSKDADIVYSTHSHYLINPLWLEFTHVVQNGIADNLTDFLHGSPTRSAITVIPYRTFVGNHPQQYFYYKPIHDALDYSPSPVEFPDNVVLVEGKTDFFAMRYFLERLGMDDLGLRIFPGGGAGTLDPLISMLYGWGKNFLVLLDSDGGGETQKRRYREKFESLVDDRIYSLADVFGVGGERIESIIEPGDKERIRMEMFPGEKLLSKKHLHIALQELIAAQKDVEFSSLTVDRFYKLFLFLFQKLSFFKKSE